MLTWTGHLAGLAGVALVVLSGTAAWHESPWAGWLLAVALVVVALVAAACRWAPTRSAVVGAVVAGSALMLWAQPLVSSPSALERLGIAAFWALPTVAALLVGGYPRLTGLRHRRALIDARRSQQVALAQDLHDLVAHEVSGIVTQAQAARFVAGDDPAAAASALARIERSGLAALDSIDHSIEVLRDPALSRAALPGVDGIRATLRRFAEAGPARTRVDIDPEAERALSPAAAATAHRVVLEALTNVRRHAPRADHVHVVLGLLDGTVRLTVRNDLRCAGLGRRRGGTGLRTLAERVRDVGGTLEAAADQDEWRLALTLPTEPNGAHP